MAGDKNPGQWEVVAGKPGKTKAKAAPTGAGKTADKSSKPQPPMIKVEELVTPMDTRFALLDPQLRAQSKKEALGIADKEKTKTKAAAAKEAPKKKTAPKETVKEKEKTFKSLQEAINHLNAAEFRQLKETVKARFSGTPLFWLRDMTTYLNQALNVETEPAFSGKPQDYPASLLSTELRTVITSTLLECDSQTLQTFYEQSVLTMTTDINRGAKVCGTKLMLQLVSFHKPSLAVANLKRFKETLAPLESRIPASLSLLWVLSQSAVKDTRVGVQVWMEAMLPMVGLKNYAAFVGQAAARLAADVKAKDVKLNRETVSVADYFQLHDLVNGSASAPASAVRKELAALLAALTRPMAAAAGAKMLSQWLARDSPADAVGCLKADATAAFEQWRREYKTKPAASANLLEWTLQRDVAFARRSAEFRAALLHFRGVNEAAPASAAAAACADAVDALLAEVERPAAASSSSGRRPRLNGLNWLLLAALLATVAYDVRVHGGGRWSSSRCGVFLRQLGVQDRVLDGYRRVDDYVRPHAAAAGQWLHVKSELYLPGVWQQVDDKCRLAAAWTQQQAEASAVLATRWTEPVWNAAVEKGAAYAAVLDEATAEYRRQAAARSAEAAQWLGQRGADAWQAASVYGSDAWQVVSVYGADAWQVVSVYGADAWQAASVYGAEARRRAVELADGLRLWGQQLVAEERVQQAWKYTLDAYHRAMHAVGICTH